MAERGSEHSDRLGHAMMSPGSQVPHFRTTFASALAPLSTSVASTRYSPAGSLSADGRTKRPLPPSSSRFARVLRDEPAVRTGHVHADQPPRRVAARPAGSAPDLERRVRRRARRSRGPERARRPCDGLDASTSASPGRRRARTVSVRPNDSPVRAFTRKPARGRRTTTSRPGDAPGRRAVARDTVDAVAGAGLRARRRARRRRPRRRTGSARRARGAAAGRRRPSPRRPVALPRDRGRARRATRYASPAGWPRTPA